MCTSNPHIFKRASTVGTAEEMGALTVLCLQGKQRDWSSDLFVLRDHKSESDFAVDFAGLQLYTFICVLLAMCWLCFGGVHCETLQLWGFFCDGSCWTDDKIAPQKKCD